MKKKWMTVVLMTVLTFFGTAGVSAVNWVFFEENGIGGQVYIDTDSIVGNDNIKRISAFETLSELEGVIYCVLIDRQGRDVILSYYQIDWQGNILDQWEATDARDFNMEPIQAGSVIQDLYNYVWGH